MDSRAPPSLIGLGAKLTDTTGDFLAPRPAHGDYSSCFSFPTLDYSTLCSTATISRLSMTVLRTQDIRPIDIISPYDQDSFRFFLVLPSPVLLGYLCFCALVSLVFKIRMSGHTVYRRWCRFLHLFTFTGVLLLPSFSHTFVCYVEFFVTGLYVVTSIAHTIRRCGSKRAAQKLAHDLYLFLCTGIKYTLPVELVMTRLHDCRVCRGHKI